jgi:hypothetical protein
VLITEEEFAARKKAILGIQHRSVRKSYAGRPERAASKHSFLETAGGATVTAASTTSARPSRARIIGVRALLVLGVLLTVVSILSTYVKREALDQGQFEQTSRALIESPAIQEQVSAVMVDALFSNVDVSAELKSNLPANLQPLAGPLAGISQGFADTAAQKLLARPRVQDTFVALASASQSQVVKVLHGDTKALETTNGNVVLDLRPLVLKLGDRFGFVEDLAAKVPQDAGQVTILKSEDLNTAQTITHWLEQVANYVWILALACWVGAIWLARGRRRQEVRALGIGLIVVGVLVLLVRWLAGNYLVDNIVANDSVRPAASDAWNIITASLAAAGWVSLAFGVLIAVGAWLVGPGERATAARVAVAPTLRRVWLAWGLWALGVVVIAWILPIQMFRTTAILVVGSAIGFVVFRRQVAAETTVPPGPEAPAEAPAAPDSSP